MVSITTVEFDGYENSQPWLIFKYPNEHFKIGTSLLVKRGQEALVFKGGRNCEIYQSGMHILNAENLPYRTDKMFTAEIYFVNITSKLDMNWGTQTPFQLEDPKYKLIIAIRSYGKYGLRIQNSRMFVSELIGTLQKGVTINYTIIASYFSSMLTTKIKTLISKFMIKKQISFLEITAYLDELSVECQEVIADEFERFGVDVQNFYIESIKPPKEDVEKLKKYKEEIALGLDFYEKRRSFDILENSVEHSAATSVEDVGKGLRILQNGNLKNSGFCPSCGYRNEQNTNFCGNCGHKLVKICSRCEKVCKPEEKFCSNCGTQL